MTNNQTHLRFISIDFMKLIPGYTAIMRQSSFFLLLTINTNASKYKTFDSLDKAIKKILPSYEFKEFDKNITISSTIQRILNIVNEIIKASGMPVFENCKAIFLEDNKLKVFIPALGNDTYTNHNICKWLIDFFNNTLLEINTNYEESLSKLIHNISTIAPQGFNTLRLLQSANDLNIPWQHICNNTFQFGWGRKSRLFDSSITDRTSAIGVSMARDKMVTSKMLETIGLPIPKHIQVFNEQEVLNAVKELKYPLVVKPIDLDGGVGVMADLKNEKNLFNAYNNAKQFSSNIIIEQHFTGREYRLHVCNNEVYYATERIHGGVTGDDKHNIKELLEFYNKDRIHPHLTLDHTALELLEEHGLNVNSIPIKGQFIKLRRVVNVSAGGVSNTIEDLTIIHPDNKSLAIRAAQVLRLDVSAIDLIMPDISQSWLRVGAIINEVNAMPQIGSDERLTYLLKKQVIDDGRIPTLLIFGESQNAWLDNLIEELISIKKNVGVVFNQEVSINKRLINTSIKNAYEGSKILINSQHIDIAIICINDFNMLEEGLAIDIFNTMILKKLDNINSAELFEYIKSFSQMCQKIHIDSECNNTKLFQNLEENKVKEFSSTQLYKQLIRELS